ncbi:glycoside hydrolase family 43 protein [Cytobacillus oceanisediminis]|uniref:glycoside hydrolase family 43 protein n=1 Tax=Cytobacillus oceanisediminis TaxID=665099 RepID=UPI001CCF18E1|nr:glycoside hydrolase family 43 protein [Cytobacillus oceanisediminis]MBZ9537065.1 glycoside hydrolase family 43 protein [Cytobacillus oceanisediminis]
MGKLTFHNPILDPGADPWVYKEKDTYYFMVTKRTRLDLWKSPTLSGMAQGTCKTIWTAPSEGINCANIWAPEIHRINGKWYIYFTANDGIGDDQSRKIFVLENSAEDPFNGDWVERGYVNTEYPGLDGTIFEHKGRLYFVYAGYGNFPEYGSALYIAEMENPWTLTGPNVLLSKPEYDWEKQGGMAINEGPVMLKRNNKLFLVYSASTTWSDDYSLGMLTTSENKDVMNPEVWVKSTEPVFKKSIENKVFAPGHNSFTQSPDGTEDWIVYHAISESEGGSQQRSTRIQKFNWNADGSPNFGIPLCTSAPITIPSGE